MEERIYKSVMEFWINLSLVLYVIFFGINYYLWTVSVGFLVLVTLATSTIMLFMLLLIFKTLTKTRIGRVLAVAVLFSILPTMCYFMIEQSREVLSVHILKYSNLLGGIIVAILGIGRSLTRKI
jgi:hypothetical protein